MLKKYFFQFYLIFNNLFCNIYSFSIINIKTNTNLNSIHDIRNNKNIFNSKQLKADYHRPNSEIRFQTPNHQINYQPTYSPPQCLIPPDFWCDNPNIALLCTGSTNYCNNYRRNRYERKIDLKLAFESGCPDSQKLIVNRLYPKILNNPEFVDFIDFNAFPWGLSRRLQDQSVRCHHGPRECLGNRLLSCILNIYKWDRKRRNNIFYCFMKQMMITGSDPMNEMKNCLAQVWASETMIEEIRRCGNGSQSYKFQIEDEHNTKQILTQKPRFVPFMSYNGFSHIQIQSSLQLFFVEKMRHWNKTIGGNEENNQLQNIDSDTNERLRTTKSNPKECHFPPEFWCIDPKISQQCFNKELCNQQFKSIYGRPINFKIIFNSKFEESRNYLNKYILNNLLNIKTLKLNNGKMFVELEPLHLTNQELEECGFSEWCAQRILEICIAASVEDINQRNNLLLCLNSKYGQINSNWIYECSFSSEVERQSVLNCAQNDQIWQTQNTKYSIQQTQPFLGPEPIKNNLWILINNYSLSTIQNYIYILEQMVCLWYNGPGHNRDNCGRCEYEPSRC